MSMRTVIVLQLGEVGVLGLPVGGRLDGVGGVGDLGGGGLRLLLADDDGDRGLSRLAVRELQQVEVVGGHRGGGASSKTLEPSRRLETAALVSTGLIDPIGALVLVEGRRGGRRFLRAWNRDAPVGSASGLEGAHDNKKKSCPRPALFGLE